MVDHQAGKRLQHARNSLSRQGGLWQAYSGLRGDFSIRVAMTWIFNHGFLGFSVYAHIALAQTVTYILWVFFPNQETISDFSTILLSLS
jgi:hypothetical protein